MAEPGTTVAGGVAGYKLLLLGLPLAASLVGFWLGLRFVPLRKGRELQDVTHRMTACAISSFVLGLPAMLLLQRYAPDYITAVMDLSSLLQLDPLVGVLALIGAVFLVCSIPGPWLLAAVFLYMQRRANKDAGQLVSEWRGKAGKP